ncbi:MAG TPA: fibronectin type III domain-containing protein, partial [Humisphaera sp.]
AIKVAAPTDLKAKSFTADTVATVPAGSNPTPTLIVDPATGDPQVVFYSATDDGVFVARKDAQNTSGTTTTQLKSGGGEGFTAAIQPGNNSISFGVIDTSGDGGGSGGPVQLNNTETTPLPPTDVAASAAGPNAVSIGWTDQSNNETGFRVERSVDGTTFETIGLVAPDVTSFLDDGCDEGTTYYYRVSALGGSGEASIGLVAGAQNANALNRVVTVQTPAKAPTGLAAAAASSARIDLAWTDNSSAETGFKVYRKAGGGAFALVATLAANSTSFADTTVAEGTGYTYRVVAARGVNESAASNDAAAVSLPATPTGVTVTRVSTTALAVAWTNNSSAAAQFVLQRSTNGTTFATVATLPNFTTTYTDTGLAEGSAYYYRVKAVGLVDSTYSAIANGTTDPNAPTNLTAAPASTTRIDLSWTDASANETGFVVQRSVNGGESYLTIGTVGAGVTTFADTAASQGTTYKYRVRATIEGAADSAYSGVVTTAVVPGAPSGLTASPSGGGYTVTLTWADTATGETAFQVQRQQQGTDAWVSLPDAAANATSYTDATAAEGTTYSYRVRAVNAYASSAYADAATATTVPNAPTGLVVTTAGTTAINLSWTDNSAGETGFVVERSADGGETWQSAGTPAAGVTTLADTGLTAATAYTYRVRAVNAGGASANTTAVAGTTLTLAPTGLAVTGTTAGTVGLSWTPATGATGYKVQRSTDGTNFSDHGTTESATFTDSLSVAEATAYTYRVIAVNAGGDSAASSTAAATTRPAAPSGLTATAASATSVTLAWADNSAGETGYEVERAPAGSESFAKIADRPAGATGYTDATAVEGTAYAYRVRATGTGGTSAYTSTATATTVPAAPTAAAAAADSATAITVTWTDASANETGYRLERSANGSTGWAQVGSALAAGTQSAQDTGLTANTTYYYRVVAVGAGGDSAAAAASATTRTVAPTGTSASVTSTTAIRLDWNTVAGADGYVVQEQVGGEWVEVDVATTNTYTVTGLDEATDHTFRVLAHNAGGLSAPGTAVDATTMPAAPAAATVTANSATSVTVSWEAVSAGAQGYFVEVSTDGGGTFHDAGDVARGDQELTVTVEEGTSPQFRVRALRNGVYSAYSDVVTVDTAPAAPTGVAVASTSASALTVTWADHSAHETGFRVERATTDNDEDYVQVGTAAADATSYVDATVAEGT